jgi:hypothetical protein
MIDKIKEKINTFISAPAEEDAPEDKKRAQQNQT